MSDGSAAGGISPQPHRAVLAIAIALVLVKLWLVSEQRMTAVGPAGHDDHLYLYLANSLAQGRWLGAYSHMTLIKGPFYPMWIAMSFASGIPLLLSEHLLYAAACAVLAVALSPALPSRRLRLALFALLFFCPLSFADGPMTRVVRESIYVPLTLLVLATALGLALRLDEPLQATRGWIAGLGASLAAFWLCREERIWIVPALLVIAGWSLLRWPRREVLRRGLAPLGLAAALVSAVVLINGFRYGAFVITEFTEGAYPRAYAALTHVGHEKDRLKVFLPAETRRRIYAASPRFAELEPFLEGEVGRGWIKPACDAFGICDEIGSGWLMWALRDAAAAAGHYRDGGEAARYWSAVADEVASACGKQMLKCRAWSLGFLPPLRREHIQAFPRAVLRGAAMLVNYDGATPHPAPSTGPAFLLVDFRDIARARLMPAPAIEEQSTPRRDRLEALQERILGGILAAYRGAIPLLAAAASIAFVVAAAWRLRRRRPSPLLFVSVALLVAAATRVLLLALIEVTAFSGITVGYLAPGYPLVLGFIVVAIAAVAKNPPSRAPLLDLPP
jgi:hypothetical protein